MRQKYRPCVLVIYTIGLMNLFYFSVFALAKEISNQDFKRSKVYCQKAINYGFKNKLKEAEEALKKSLQLNPFNRSSVAVLKWIEDFKEGVISREYIQCLFEASRDVNLNIFKSAIEKLQKAIQINPTYPSSYYNIGLCYLALGNYQQAIAYYKKVVEIKPSAEAYHGLASAYGYAQQHQEVINYSQKSLGLDPKYALSYFNLGVAYWNLKQYDKAKENLQRAMELLKQEGNDNDAAGVEEELQRLKTLSQ